MKYFCRDDAQRRIAIQQHGTLNGIDFLEVLDEPGMPNDQRQRTLFVHFIKKLAALFTVANVTIEGGDIVKNVQVNNVVNDEPNVLRVDLDRPGDFSTYTLRLREDHTSDTPPADIDPILSSIDFSFKVNCTTDFDCLVAEECPVLSLPQPEIDYLAKDYASFRRLMLDRMSEVVPDWIERSPADMGVALVELLSYVGDYLSYRQDAVATEAYLSTARSRISVRRHVRLVDYHMHDGVNARAWVQITVDSDDVVLDKGEQITTRVAGITAPVINKSSSDFKAYLRRNPVVFETMHSARLYEDHNELFFYTWGERKCCLPRGATKATLHDHHPNLKAGDVLIFVEKIGPHTGDDKDADIATRHAVRLTHVVRTKDPLGNRLSGNGSDQAVDVTDIEWAVDDALPFPFCVSAETDEEHGSRYVDKVSTALGNIVLADHGFTLDEDEELGLAPKATIQRLPVDANGDLLTGTMAYAPGRFQPRLDSGPLTFATPLPQKLFFDFKWTAQIQTDLDAGKFTSALRQIFQGHPVTQLGVAVSVQGSGGEWSVSDGKSAYLLRQDGTQLLVFATLPPAELSLQQQATDAEPQFVDVVSDPEGARTNWTARRDLLSSDANSTEFVVEIESDGVAHLRFNTLPPEQVRNTARYRVGNGAIGNVGFGTLAHLAGDHPHVTGVSNPLAAQGGTDPETIEQAQRLAPYAYKTQRRAVTPEDYAVVAARHPEVQRAAATLRWTGSGHTIFITIDRVLGQDIDDIFEEKMLQYLDRYRMAGHAVEIDSPRFVSLEIDMHVCVEPDYFRSQVRRELLRIFSSRLLADGSPALFHADRLTFEQSVFLSPIYAAAEAVDGVAFVDITKFQRLGNPKSSGLDSGKIEMGRLEIARLDNDRNYPDHGVFQLTLEGGK